MERVAGVSRRIRGQQHGTAIVEAVIALPILLAVILGAVQFGLIHEAKATLNFAALQAARAGAVSNAELDAIRGGLARGLAPLYSPESSLAGVATTVARIEGQLAQDARIRILNPTREAFDDFGEEVAGVREIPNDRLHARDTTVGAASGMNIQDANLLRVQITYGYEMNVPLVNWFIARTLRAMRRSGARDAFEQQLLRRGRLPIVTTATVRMQSPARMSDAVAAREDLPEIARIDADARPPDDTDDAENDEDEEDGDSDANDDGSSLADGFLGFGEGSGDGGAGSSNEGAGGSGGNSGGSAGGGSGGGNSGSPRQCDVDDGGASPFPTSPPPGDSSPLPPRPSPFPFPSSTAGSVSLSVGLPSLSVGNPIHVVTGNKYQQEIDLPTLPGTLALAFVRHYNSDAAAHVGAMGAGWRHGYEASIAVGDGGASLDLWQADGRHLRFTRVDATLFLAQRAGDGEVRESAEGWVWHWPSRRRLDFNRAGQLQRIREGTAVLTLHYDAQARLERVLDPQQRELRFDYYANGRIARVRAPGGASWRYAYDAVGNLAVTAGSDGRARRYDYHDARHVHHLTDISAGVAGLADYGDAHRLQPIAHWAYDAQGRGILSTHPDDAGKVSLVYGDGYTDVTDAFGRVSRYISEMRDGIALVTQVRGPGCGTCGQGDVEYEFDAAFQVTQIERRDAPVLRYAYDAQRRLTRAERGSGSELRLLARYEYNGDGRPVRVHLPSVKEGAAHSIALAYRSDGALQSLRESGYSPNAAGAFTAIERTTKFLYDRNGRLASIDGPRRDVSDVTRFAYDDYGRLIETQALDGGRMRIEAFDGVGRPMRVSRTGRPTMRMEYDAVGRLTGVAELRSAPDRSGRRVRYTYDALGRLEKIVDADGRTQRIGYDTAGRPDRFALDDSGMGAILRYAADGAPTTATLLRGATPLRALRYVYDDERRLKEIRDGDGPPLRQIEYREHDSQPYRVIDPLKNVTEFGYDDSGNPVSVLAPDGGLTRFERDEAGHLAQVIAPNDARTRYDYDDFGRRVREENADRGVIRYAYDAADNLVARTDANGTTLRVERDAAHRIVKVHRREGVTTLAYDKSHLVSIVAPESREAFEYDNEGLLQKHVRQMGGHTFVTLQAFDPQGRLHTRTLPSGQQLRHHYTASGALRAITRETLLHSDLIAGQLDAQPQRASVDAMGKLAYGNGLLLQNLYDAKTGYLARRTTLGLAALKYDYDESGRVIGIDEDSGKGKGQRKYAYDAAGRLTNAQLPRGDFAYRYDTSGNRIEDSRTTLRNAERSNRLIETQYDAAGSPTHMANRRYEYNSEGRPIRLHIDGKLVASYAYNPNGERIRKTLHAGREPQTTFYLYERHQLVAEADARGRITREYLYLGQHPVAMIESSTLYWLHTDHLGTPQSVTDDQQRVVWRADYEPFGAAHADEDPDHDGNTLTLNLRFPGQYADAESGTHYNLMRDYDPQTGRYLTPDPLGLADGVNPYAYVHGNPVSHTDSLGLYDEMVHYYMTYFLALVAGLPQDSARTMAIASQYVDENPLTTPVNTFIGLPTGANERALPLYHFVLDERSGEFGDRSSDPLRRFYDPASSQLSNLLNSTDPARLRELWRQANPHLNACPTPWTINDARYQLYGEYLHAYEDTFSHRDLLNMPYAVDANSANTPFPIFGGHTGLHGDPFAFRQPDRTYNQDEDDEPSVCTVRYMLGGEERREGLSEQACLALRSSPTVAATAFVPRPSKCEYVYFRHREDILGTREVVRGLTESQCTQRADAAGAVERHFLPQGDLWAYNELRTLRMEYEIFNRLGNSFAAEIASNRANLGVAVPQIAWLDLAGRDWDDRNPQANARLGVEQSYDEWRRGQGLSEVSTILQRFNASEADERDRRDLLNAWLRDNQFKDANGDPLKIEPWPGAREGARRRESNIGWIPSGTLTGVLLPSAER